MEHRLLVAKGPLFWIFRTWKIRSFLRQKVDGKIIFTDYLKVLVLNFSGMGNTVFFWGKKSMERWYLLFTEKFLFGATETFFAFLHKTFRWWKIRLFFWPKSWCKDNIYLVFFSFPWYSRNWEIRFFVQWIFWQKLDLLKPVCSKRFSILATFLRYINIFGNTCIKNAQFNLFYQYLLLLSNVKHFSNLLKIKKEMGVALLAAIFL